MTYSLLDHRVDMGKRLREERKRLGMSQETLAALGAVRKQAQLKYESGQSAPSADYLAMIEVRGVDVGYVLTGTPSADLAPDEADLLQRYRAAHPAVRAAITAALSTVGDTAAREHPAECSTRYYVHENRGQVVQGDQHIAGALTINVKGSKKGSRK